MDLDMDDDEFGDLYTDILPAVAAPPPPPSSAPDPPKPLIPPQTTPSGSVPDATAQTLAPEKESDADWILGPAPITEEHQDWNEEEDSKPPVKVERGEEEVGVRVPEEEEVSKLEVEEEIGGFDGGAIIPGLSFGAADGGGFGGTEVGMAEEAKSEDWDSDDSGDDLQIVLNDDSVEPHGLNRIGGGDDVDDEDGEDGLVIVTDEDQIHHHHQAMEEQELGEESVVPTLDGEKKDMSEATKVGAGPGVVGANRVGYSGHGFHPQHHSQFKYVRPGVVSGPGVPPAGAGSTGQIRPFMTGPGAGRGRGFVQRGSGYGLPAWGNSTSARPFGSGLEFTLPSHKTIFDVDIDAFEEKPWRLPGIDISDFFNFELDEDNWKGYCKQLEQLRLESTMQSRIRVYESGRSEQDYDPDLPPELAAASGLQDISGENVVKVEGAQSNLFGQGREPGRMRPQLPTGRAIQVENSNSERYPSIDTRPPRPRDPDVIIEIVLQGSLDDSEQPGNGAVVNDFTEEYEGKERNSGDLKCHDRFPATQNGERSSMSSKMHSMDNGVSEEAAQPPSSPEGSVPYYHSSKMRSSSPRGRSGRHYMGRQMLETHKRDDEVSDEHINDDMSNQNARTDTIQQGEKLEADTEAKSKNPSNSADAKESSSEDAHDEHDDRVALADSTEEREEIASDFHNSGDTPEGSSSSYSVKKQKLDSQMKEYADLDNGEGGNLANIGDSRAKSDSGNDYIKHGDDAEYDNTYDARPRPSVSRRHHDHKKQSLQVRGDYGRGAGHEIDRSRVVPKGKEALRRPHVHRELDPNPSHYAVKSVSSERPSEREISGIWRKRDIEGHGRRMKDRDFPEYSDEMRSRSRSKLRTNDRMIGGEDLYMKRQADDRYWRGRHDRESGPRQKESGKVSLSRRETIDDPHASRRQEEDYHLREKSSKEFLHSYRAGDDSDRRMKSSMVRSRDKTEDYHFTGHRDESRRHREGEDRQRSKQTRDKEQRERDEGQNIVRNSHAGETKLYNRYERTKDGSKGSNPDKDPTFRGKHNEQLKRGGHTDTQLQHKEHQETHGHDTQIGDEFRSSKNGRPTHSHHSQASDAQHISSEMRRSSSRKVKESEAMLGKRKHGDGSSNQSEKASKNATSEERKRVNGKESNQHADANTERTQEDKFASDDESQQESRRGRSKLERWTSNQERDYESIGNRALFSSKNMEINDIDTDPTQTTDEVAKIEVNKAADNSNVVQVSDKEETDRHLETVEKLKKRSERFKLPMPVEDTTSKKVENEVSAVQNDTAACLEIKQERPARKRRWGSS